MKNALVALFVTALSVLATGCNTKVVDQVKAEVFPNLESVRISLLFDKGIQSPMGGSYEVGNYGSLFLDPSTANAPLTAGFDLKLSVVNDTNYIHYTPTTLLPSEDPLPGVINRALAQVKMERKVGDKWDVYAYLDILGREWLGVVVMLDAVDEKNFPAGLSIMENFLKDSQGNARASAVAFGAHTSNGKTTSGGFGIFANVASLLKSGNMFMADKGYDHRVFFNGNLISGRPVEPF